MATPRLPTSAAPAPIERYAVQFDDLFLSRSQRQGFRDLLVGLLRPHDRNKTLTALADAEPGRDGSHHREAQRLHRFLAESPWDAEQVTDHVAYRATLYLKVDPRALPREYLMGGCTSTLSTWHPFGNRVAAGTGVTVANHAGIPRLRHTGTDQLDEEVLLGRSIPTVA